ncbi:MAG: hypothetical protein F9K29_08760 [Hyphomicrobiaceae bacterium]|nr:MAG: hypothetical protein F9K29_08760 [Hyphomicrobiaceae bacterium]
MHTLIMVVSGLIGLGLFVLAATLLNKGAADGARYFILPWLVVSLVNLYIGVTQAGVPFAAEAAVLIVVFGVPAALAWHLSRRTGTPG